MQEQPDYMREIGLEATGQEVFSIRELASEFDVTTRAIRFYEDKGLLNPARNGVNRVYRRGDRMRLALILRGKRLGFSLQEIQEMFDAYYHHDGAGEQLKLTLAKSRERMKSLEQQREDIDKTLSELKDICRQLEEELSAQGVDIKEL